MIQLVYMSHELYPMKVIDIASILSQARQSNTQSEICGYLIYYHQSFFQVLEGEEEKVSHLFERIKKDPRHEEVTLLLKHIIQQKNFNNWSMGYFDENDIENPKNIELKKLFTYYQDRLHQHQNVDAETIDTVNLITKKLHTGNWQNQTL